MPSDLSCAARRWSARLFFIVLLSGCSSGGSDGGGGAAAPAPTANAGADEMAAVGVPVALDGSASDSPTGVPVSYQWTLSGKPAGSTAFLTNPTSVRPAFTPDVSGSYTATLVVQASGVPSAPDAVAITAVTGNVAPRADAGPDANAAPSRPIMLDGSASRDPNNTTVTYSWRIVEQPPGSHPTLTNATSAKPTFTADMAGRYVLALVCSDGTLTSPVDQVVIIVATGNLPPVANAGPDQTVTNGQLVTLDGTGSTDPNGDPLSYSWCLRGRPEGSTATLSGANTAHPTFTPDVAGSYVLCLTVNDGQSGSASDSVVVQARVAPFNQGSGFNDRVNSIVLAQDGTEDIYVGGVFTAYQGTVANRLIRLHPDGTVVQVFGQGFDNLVYTLVLAKTGGSELYVRGGFTRFDGQPVPPIIRLTAAGALDSGFQLPAEFSSFTGPVTLSSQFVAAEDGSGDLYVTFTRFNPLATTPVDTLLNIARLNADGTVDSAFSTGDGFPTGSMGCPQTIDALMPMPSGKLYVGGSLTVLNDAPVPSLLRLNPNGALDSTFTSTVGSLCDLPSILALVPANDGTTDLYGSRWNAPLIRLHDTGAFDTSFKVDVTSMGGVIAVTQDGSGDVLVASMSPATLFRFSRTGALVSAPTFVSPTLDSAVATIVPLQDGTGDFYIGGLFKRYNGVAVNHFARIHADGSLASVVSGQ
jgi:hypothetical protein